MLEFLAHTLEVVGALFIAYAALSVHHRVLHEHRVDNKVFRTMKLEQKIGIFGVILVLVGYGLSTYLQFFV